jgi:IS5 family transposase
VLHAKALRRKPYDGHSLGPVIADLERLTGAAVRRIHGDKGYRGHNDPNRFKVWIRGQVRRVTKAVRPECAVAPPLSPRSAVSRTIIGCVATISKAERRPIVLVAADFNFGLLRRWSEEWLLRVPL